MKSVRVRMYRQGLGDCFLLTFPRASGDAHVLIDCGVLLGTDNATSKITRVAESIVKTTGGRLDALVITHQHWDHVSGFLQAESVFNRLAVDEVWLAWTENPEDELARDLTDRKTKALAAVNAAARRLSANTDFHSERVVQRLKGLLEFHGELGVDGRKTTAQAMAWVKARKDARVRYFTPGTEPIEINGLDGLRVFVLGPPRDAKMLRKSNPSKRTSEVYELARLGSEDLGFLAAVTSIDGESPTVGQPFDEWFRVTEAEAWESDFFGSLYGFEGEGGDDWRRIETDWLGVAGRLALQLDSHTNNTSLALAFELLPSGRVLLFPGDAQVGNWLSWAPQSWQVENGFEKRSVTTADLLARTVLYKVGHHGSHNATLREQGLELMSSRELTAMLPVDRAIAKQMAWQMPFPTLYRRLHELTKGRILDLEKGIPSSPPDGTTDRDWDWFLARANAQRDWLDFHVDVS